MTVVPTEYDKWGMNQVAEKGASAAERQPQEKRACREGSLWVVRQVNSLDRTNGVECLALDPSSDKAS